MQPGPNPEDIQGILSRFQTWAEKQPAEGNGNGHKNGDGADELREIPYEEAIRQLRSRQAAPTQRRPARPRVRTAAASGLKLPVKPAPSPPSAEDAAPWISQLPVIPDNEPVIELRSAPALRSAEPVLPGEGPTERWQPSMPLNGDALVPPPAAKPSPARQAPIPKQARKTDLPKPPLTAAAPDILAETTVKRTQPATPAAPAPRPALKTAPSPPPVKRAAPAQTRFRKVAAPAKTTSSRRPQPAQNRTRSSIIQAQSKMAARIPTQAKAPRQRAAAAPARTRKPKRPPFRKVLANSIQHPRIAAAPKRKPEPDRTRRITTRFTPGEERRIEKLAAEFGLTVSAYLRQCALASLAAQNTTQDPIFAMGTKGARNGAEPPSALRTYSAPVPSLVGGWLSLLRNRFLGPPIRFSEEA